ncbi:DUF3237 domain-containing protein [Streptomyces sp. ISL-12]|uniref:DUF3237 domain-containing protein n=1 Tax=Streptomyces sp. ISL-12 TaxID=2819177 RepID=UPI001BEA7343|nr:DUF3237 domain-containing protein [Streptomyces sp. ISL-12]MBT2413300.1 DUF3237 domain-containing protein [Streptomyces sp. ISL-12]
MATLVKEFDFYVDLATEPVGDGPFGDRVIAEGVGGGITGDRLKGTITAGGGDWLLVGDDGYARVDVRSTFDTHDGAAIYVQYFGLIEMTRGIKAVLSGGDEPTAFGEQYFMITPRMETGDKRYAWVNQTVFVGEGRLLPGLRVEFRVYSVALS